ncbi:MAG TPA: HIT family protein [Polyangiaceae bacterium]
MTHPPCPFCAADPDETDEWLLVTRLAQSKLWLSKNQTYRGHCSLVFLGRHVERLDDLDGSEFQRFVVDLRSSLQAVRHAFAPDHVNVEMLGNVVRHLHAHVIPRYQDDPRWGQAIWMTDASQMPVTKLPRAELEARVAQLRAALA